MPIRRAAHKMYHEEISMQFVTQEDLDRINELYHKSRTAAGLTAAEKSEQTALRQKYIAAVRSSLRSNLDRIDIREEDGSVTNLGEKYNPEGLD